MFMMNADKHCSTVWNRILNKWVNVELTAWRTAAVFVYVKDKIKVC